MRISIFKERRPTCRCRGDGRVRRLLRLACITSALSACSPNVAEESFTEPTTNRPYRLVVSADHRRNVPTPVLFALHAYRTEPEILVDSFSLKRDAAEKRGWILVVPEGKRNRKGDRYWNATNACCAHNDTARPDDVAYLRAVLHDVRRRYKTDAGRVFAIGESNGAFMAYRWACDNGGDLRAVVGLAGSGPGPLDPPCLPGRPVNILHVHGDDDELISYHGKAEGKQSYPSAMQHVAMWAKLNGLEGKAVVESIRSDSMGRVRRKTWQNDEARVSLWTVIGGRHNIQGRHRAAPQFLSFLENR